MDTLVNERIILGLKAVEKLLHQNNQAFFSSVKNAWL